MGVFPFGFPLKSHPTRAAPKKRHIECPMSPLASFCSTPVREDLAGGSAPGGTGCAGRSTGRGLNEMVASVPASESVPPRTASYMHRTYIDIIPKPGLCQFALRSLEGLVRKLRPVRAMCQSVDDVCL